MSKQMEFKVKNQTVKNWPQSERPRERLIHCGVDVLSDAELLAILLRTGVQGCSVVDLARKLLSEAGGIRELLLLSVQDFKQLHGMGEAKYAQLQAASEIGKRILQQSMQKQIQCSGSEQTKDFLSMQLRDKPYEVFAVLFLDTRHSLLGFKELFRGTINGAAVSIREVVKEALEFNAASLIVAHNHPSGVAEPSNADRQLTLRLTEALNLVDIKLLDHIVVGDQECVSFAERALL